MTEIREVLRAWLSGAGPRKVDERAGANRKTARRYLEAALAAGLSRHGAAWDALEACQEQIARWVKDGLSVVKIGGVSR